MTTVTFNACKFLNYDDRYAAKKELISSSGEIKVVWNRLVPDASYPSLVQFCGKVGRINQADGCLCKEKAQCHSYKEFQHTVDYEPT